LRGSRALSRESRAVLRVYRYFLTESVALLVDPRALLRAKGTSHRRNVLHPSSMHTSLPPPFPPLLCLPPHTILLTSQPRTEKRHKLFGKGPIYTQKNPADPAKSPTDNEKRPTLWKRALHTLKRDQDTLKRAQHTFTRDLNVEKIPTCTEKSSQCDHARAHTPTYIHIHAQTPGLQKHKQRSTRLLESRFLFLYLSLSLSRSLTLSFFLFLTRTHLLSLSLLLLLSLSLSL